MNTPVRGGMSEGRPDKRIALRRMQRARERVMDEIRENSNTFYGAGLASEGYAGGYRDALDDCMAALTHGYVQRRYWRD